MLIRQVTPLTTGLALGRKCPQNPNLDSLACPGPPEVAPPSLTGFLVILQSGFPLTPQPFHLQGFERVATSPIWDSSVGAGTSTAHPTSDWTWTAIFCGTNVTSFWNPPETLHNPFLFNPQTAKPVLFWTAVNRYDYDPSTSSLINGFRLTRRAE